MNELWKIVLTCAFGAQLYYYSIDAHFIIEIKSRSFPFPIIVFIGYLMVELSVVRWLMISELSNFPLTPFEDFDWKLPQKLHTNKIAVVICRLHRSQCAPKIADTKWKNVKIIIICSIFNSSYFSAVFCKLISFRSFLCIFSFFILIRRSQPVYIIIAKTINELFVFSFHFAFGRSFGSSRQLNQLMNSFSAMLLTANKVTSNESLVNVYTFV